MISIITITFNNSNQLKETLSSIPRKNYIESIVINGGTCEETKEFLKNYWGKSLNEKDNGISDAFNKGINLSSGNVIMFINSGDVLIDEDYLNYVNEVFCENKELDYVCCDIVFDDKDIGKYIPKFGIERLRNIAKGMPFPHPGLAIRRSVFEKIGNFNLSLKIGMDFDLVCRLSKLSPIGLYYSKPVILMDGTGVSSNQAVAIDEMIKILERNDLLDIRARIIMSFRKIQLRVKKIIPKRIVNALRKRIVNQSKTKGYY